MRWHNGFVRLLTVGGMALALGVTAAAAQENIDPSGEPTYGSITLESGFAPDPFIISAVSGGSLDAASLDLGGACVGFIADVPDFRVQWNGDSALLRFYFASDGDTTLVVSGPDGIVCNDDADDGFQMLNPLVELASPAAGEYNVWIGSYDQDVYTPGYLLVTTLPVGEIAPVQSDILFDIADIETGDSAEATEEASAELLPDAAPGFEAVTLAPGSAPQSVTVLAGGWINAAALDTNAECVGFIADAPDVSLTLSGVVQNLEIAFTSEKDADDTTMVIRDSDGNFICDDDSGEGLAPLVVLDNAAAGEYDIWVGTYDDEDLINGALTIRDGSAAAAPTPAPTASPTPLLLPTYDPVVTATYGSTLMPNQTATQAAATANPGK